MDEVRWAAYARLQKRLDRTTDAHQAAGIEAAMVELLEKIAKGEPFTPTQTENLVVNRIGRERRRRAITYSARPVLFPEVTIDGIAESRLALIKCAEICGPRDFRLLVTQAFGWDYRELAKEVGVNHNTLKTRVHRARQKIIHLAA